MRKYEVMYILRSDVEQESVQAIVDKFNGVITNGGGEVAKTDLIGKRRLAYEINKQRDGIFVLVHFSAPVEVITELDRVMKIADEVVRVLIVKDVA
ncbi:30S ribosomal protein S6 [Paenibacillus sp. CCS19]|uniref:30S ribosomal protein S6 n=1 Tax=Paenibacillus sp. CCS19 TaxID=3158387 RepID=UPI00256796CE|nr:30S ribosomal protein S6 [Paenibacillus cellulosilyticus]GMK38963.1 30S ribosomal protein S6 [Paenibacillus cellulosilyticus]